MHESPRSFGPIREATDFNFEEDVLSSNDLTLVGFWSHESSECRPFAITLQQVAAQFAGRLRVFKLNMNENPGMPMMFRVHEAPTVVIFLRGRAVAQYVGNFSQAELTRVIRKYLG